MKRLPVIISIVCLVAAVGISAVAWQITRHRQMGAVSEAGVSGAVVSHGRPDIGGPFNLVNQNGAAVDQRILNGKWTVIFFGYTYCPDVCPTTLATLAATKQLLGRPGETLQVVFVSIDPERDTPASMKAYLDNIGLEGAIGLTGTPEQTAAAAKVFKIYFRKSGEGPDYLMDHSTLSYLIGPDGRYREPIPYALSPQQTATIIEDAMRAG